MKNYPKEYEDVFTSKRIEDKCALSDVSTDIDMDTTQYKKILQDTVSSFQKEIFDHLVKLDWLTRRFVYKDEFQRRKRVGNGIILDAAYGVFMRTHVGIDARLFSRGFLFQKISTYFDDFFINFDEGNPFEDDYKYPYKYMTLECLTLISMMPERLKLLEWGEGRKMAYTEFVDYILNYIGCYNDEHGLTYTYASSAQFPPYIKIMNYGKEKA